MAQYRLYYELSECINYLSYPTENFIRKHSYWIIKYNSLRCMELTEFKQLYYCYTNNAYVWVSF